MPEAEALLCTGGVWSEPVAAFQVWSSTCRAATVNSGEGPRSGGASQAGGWQAEQSSGGQCVCVLSGHTSVLL